MTARAGTGRRRFLKVAAAAAGLGLLGQGARGARAELHTWHGTALGARASIRLQHPDRDAAQALIGRVRDEIERLERVFSLYRPDSAISQLNRQGFLEAPPLDLLRLLSEARSTSERTGGAFDVTVQPLWSLNSEHFQAQEQTVGGPDAAAIEAALAAVDYRAVALDPAGIAFEKSGMAVTLNGIAQGYITDRVAELLRAAGLTDVLIDLGELRGLGRHPEGRPWDVGLKDPRHSDRLLRRLALSDAALATSAGAGTRFGGGAHHHLFDPRSGRSSNRYLSVTVKAASATLADALSTGLFHMEPEQITEVLSGLAGVEAYVTLANGEQRDWRA